MLEALKDWNDAYANMAYVEGSELLPDIWAQNAVEYRKKTAKIDEDQPYGDTSRQQFDLIWPDAAPKGLLVFVHGGYWMKFDKSYWTDLAEGARANGWAVCLPSYTLAPEARIGQITQEIGAAITAAAAQVAGPVRLAGHSAGGHLVMRMICNDTPLPAAICARLAHVVSISGVHDLRPLRHTALNDTLGIDPAEAQTESPALLAPGVQVPVTCWVGGGERPEFIRQSRLMAMIWEGLNMDMSCVIDGTLNHFSILDGLHDADSPLVQCILNGVQPKA